MRTLASPSSRGLALLDTKTVVSAAILRVGGKGGPLVAKSQALPAQPVGVAPQHTRVGAGRDGAGSSCWMKDSSGVDMPDALVPTRRAFKVRHEFCNRIGHKLTSTYAVLRSAYVGEKMT